MPGTPIEEEISFEILVHCPPIYWLNGADAHTLYFDIHRFCTEPGRGVVLVIHPIPKCPPPISSSWVLAPLLGLEEKLQSLPVRTRGSSSPTPGSVTCAEGPGLLSRRLILLQGVWTQLTAPPGPQRPAPPMCPLNGSQW